MDDAHFDAWTRRRFGLLTGGLAASLLPRRLPDALAKKRRKKKRCKKLLQTCTPGGNRKCCGRLKCQQAGNEEIRCCKGLDEPCTDSDECCGEGGTGCDEGLCKIV